MIHKNKYINSSKVLEAKFREIVKYFVADLSTTQIATLSGISRNSSTHMVRISYLSY
jgi:transposase